MPPPFLSLELYNTLLIVVAVLFFTVSLCTSYIILFKTPPHLQAYKYNFLLLIFWNQVAAFCAGLFGRLDVEFFGGGGFCATLHGPVHYFGLPAAYTELFIILTSLVNIVNSLFFSFLYRYHHICRPTSLYATNSRWRTFIKTVVFLGSAIFGAMYVISVITSNPRQIESTKGQVEFCHSGSPLFYTCFLLFLCYFTAVFVFAALFTIQILRTNRLSSKAASQKTRELRKMLTITLVVSAVIPAVFGGIPMAVGVYAIVAHVRQFTSIFRICIVICVFQGILQSVATLMLVKSYRNVVFSVFRLKSAGNAASVSVVLASQTNKL